MGNKKKQTVQNGGWSEKQKNILTVAILVVFVLLIAGICVLAINCGKNGGNDNTTTTDNSEKETLEAVTSGAEVSETPTDYVSMTVRYVNSDGQVATGDIVIHLRADVAPITVQNFKDLVADGFYNGLTFHRIISGFMIQGGDPAGNGTGGSEKTIKGEFSANGVENNLKHERGVISMARSSAYDSASSQFFIMHQTTASLDGQYAAFGEVVFGMETVDGIAGTATTGSEGSTPVNAPVILKACFVNWTEDETTGD